MKISQSENVCRVFEMPETYPQGLCGVAGKTVIFNMVDYFYPVPSEIVYAGEEFEWSEIETLLRKFLVEKPYLLTGFKYILVTDSANLLCLKRKPLIVRMRDE